MMLIKSIFVALMAAACVSATPAPLTTDAEGFVYGPRPNSTVTDAVAVIEKRQTGGSASDPVTIDLVLWPGFNYQGTPTIFYKGADNGYCICQGVHDGTTYKQRSAYYYTTADYNTCRLYAGYGCTGRNYLLTGDAQAFGAEWQNEVKSVKCCRGISA